MPPTTSALLPWIDKALKTAGHPKVERIVRAGRRRTPPTSWDRLAAEISEKAGGPVNSEMLRLNFAHLDEPKTAGEAS